MSEDRNRIIGYERVFNIIGWLGFIAVLPIALNLFGLPGMQNFLEQKLGQYGSPVFLLLYFFVLVFLRVIFGSGRIITPLIIASLTGFVLISTAANVGFMVWLRNLMTSTPLFSNMPLVFLTGLTVVALGILLSYTKRLPLLIQLAVLVVLPLVFIIVTSSTGLFSGLENIGVGSG